MGQCLGIDLDPGMIEYARGRANLKRANLFTAEMTRRLKSELPRVKRV